MCSAPFGAPGRGVWTAGPRCWDRTRGDGRPCVGRELPTGDWPQPTWGHAPVPHFLAGRAQAAQSLEASPESGRLGTERSGLFRSAALCPRLLAAEGFFSYVYSGSLVSSWGGCLQNRGGPHACRPGLHSTCSLGLQLCLLPARQVSARSLGPPAAPQAPAGRPASSPSCGSQRRRDVSDLGVTSQLLPYGARAGAALFSQPCQVLRSGQSPRLPCPLFRGCCLLSGPPSRRIRALQTSGVTAPAPAVSASRACLDPPVGRCVGSPG